MAKKKIGTSPMDAAFTYLTAKPRTVREMELYLDEKNYGEYEVYQAIERLKELNYLDDEKYAADFIASRLNTRPVSRRKLREQLYAHKLPQDVMDQALAAITDEMERANAERVVEKYYRQFMHLEEWERKQRTIRRLLARGYDFAAVRESVERIIGDTAGLDLTADEETEQD